MRKEKIDVNEFIDSKSGSVIGDSDIMKALEDIEYNISKADIDSASPDDIEHEELKEIEMDAKSYENENLESLCSGRSCN